MKEDEKIAKEILLHAEASWSSIAVHMGKDPSHKGIVLIYLPSREEDFDQLTRRGVPDWGIGCALPLENTIVLKSPRLIGKSPDLPSLIAHENSHILLYDQVKAKDSSPSKSEERTDPIPRWFDEGLAMFESKEWRKGETLSLAWSVITHSLLPLSSLETHFPTNERKAHLAYLESFSTINYLLDEYGEEGLRRLLHSLAHSSDFESALVESLGLTLKEFENEWFFYLQSRYNAFYLLSDTGILWGVISLLFLFVLILKTIQIRRKKRRLENEDWATDES